MAAVKENLTVEACPGCGALDASRRCLGCRHDFGYLPDEAGEPLSNPQRFADEIAWLREAARYFSNRPTGGEDAAHWANVYNAENANKLAARLGEMMGGAKENGKERVARAIYTHGMMFDCPAYDELQPEQQADFEDMAEVAIAAWITA